MQYKVCFRINMSVSMRAMVSSRPGLGKLERPGSEASVESTHPPPSTPGKLLPCSSWRTFLLTAAHGTERKERRTKDAKETK